MPPQQQHPAQDKQPQSCWRHLPAAAVPAGAAIFWASMALPAHPAPIWPHETAHRLLLGGSGAFALLAALFIMLMRPASDKESPQIWTAAALTGMGLLDLFCAGSIPHQAVGCLHSFGVLVGGLILPLTMLPEQRIAKLPWLHVLPCLTAAFCLQPGLGLLLCPHLRPAAAGSGQFALAIKLLHVLGGTGFAAAALHFARNRLDREAVVLAGSCGLLALAAFLVPFSSAWDALWWCSQIFHCIACLALFCLFWAACREKIAQLRRKRDELENTRKQLFDIIEHSPSLVTLRDLSGRFVLANRRVEEVFGLTKKDIVGKYMTDIMPQLSRTIESAGSDEEQKIEYEERISLKDGGTRTFLTSCFPLGGSEESPSCVGCIQTDVTDRRQMEHRLRLDQKIIENAKEAIVVTDAQATVVDINEAYTQITGYERGEIIGKNPRVSQSGRHSRAFYEEMWRQLLASGSWSGEIWDRRKNGEIFQKWLTINAIRDRSEAIINYVGVFTDLTEKRHVERKLRNLLFYDSLTKLPNRTLFHERLSQAMINSQSRDMPLALFCIDLDRFKDVNDSLGHRAGDELLVQAAKRIRSSVRSTDIVARLCGDEFTVILPEIKLREAVGHLARRLLHLLQQPFYVAGEEVFINASIGISIYPDDGRDAETLMKNADTAMNFAKEREPGNYQYFRAQMNERLVQRIALEKHLRYALENNEFVLHYQPKYALATEQIVGMEALVRWQHPQEGLISPAEFIPVAEESGMITSLGAWGLTTACRQAMEWEKQGLGRHRLSVNLSSRQFQSRALLTLLRDTLAETGLDPASLELEITESTVMENPDEAVNLLRDIRQLGVRIAIDDFGTGYSSLSYLKKFPVNTLKIDQSFVADLSEDADDAAIVESIIHMARGLNIEIVAEGVETRAQADFFKERNCQEAQGYFFSKPLPPDAFAEKLMAERKQSG